MALELSTILQLLFYLATLFFIVHAVVIGYHWMHYGVVRATSLLGVAVYLTGGAILLVTMSLTLLTL